MPSWLAFSLAYVLSVGTVGITGKLALNQVEWPLLVLSAAVSYCVLSLWFAARGTMSFPGTLGGWLLPVLVTGALPAFSFIFLMVALTTADASRVVPITAAYPAVTALLGVLFLSEQLTSLRAIGTVFIVLGAVLVAR
jgi:transporter family protein